MILPSFKYICHVLACDGQPLQSHTSAAAPVWLIRVLVRVTYAVANLFKLMILVFCFLFFRGKGVVCLLKEVLKIKSGKLIENECCISGVLCFIENIF